MTSKWSSDHINIIIKKKKKIDFIEKLNLLEP